MVNTNDIIKLSAETMENILKVLLEQNNSISISSTKLDNDFMIESYKNEDMNWVSEDDKNKTFENELVWSIFYGGNNMNGSSLVSIIEKIFIK